MTTYFDTSVLVKRYVQEPDSSLADAWLDRRPEGYDRPSLRGGVATALQAKIWRSGDLLTARRLNAAYLLFRSEVGSGKYEIAATVMHVAAGHAERSAVVWHVRRPSRPTRRSGRDAAYGIGHNRVAGRIPPEVEDGIALRARYDLAGDSSWPGSGVRSGDLFSKRQAVSNGPAVLDAPQPRYGSASDTPAMGQRRVTPPRGGYVTPETREPGDLAGLDDDGEFGERTRRRGMRVRFDGGILPQSTWGRVAAGCGAVLVAGMGVAALLLARNYILRDDHFFIVSPSSIQIVGNAHLTRPQLLSVFGGDVERNVFTMPMSQRRAELERLPWVGHATVMRLLPNRVRVSIVERTPVAFVREGSRIGLVDTHGVLLDMSTPEAEEEGAAVAKPVSYSFPVLTGIAPGDPLSTRAARMKIYTAFVAALDSTGEHISRKLSEVDLSNPEDVKAILPEHGVDVLVHFGDERFLERYRKFEEHLPEWRNQYPKLASVDMRYERQVVLEMAAGTAVPPNAAGAVAGAAGAATLKPADKVWAEPVKPVVRTPLATAKTPTASVKSPTLAVTKSAASAPKPNSDETAPAHLTMAFPVAGSSASASKTLPAKPSVPGKSQTPVTPAPTAVPR